MEFHNEFTLKRNLGKWMKILAYVKHEKNKYFTQPKLFIKITFKIYSNTSENFINLSSIFIDSELDKNAIPLLNFY